MKILRLFDSLKFVRFVVAAIACTLILNVANAATLPAGYTELEYIHFVNGVGNIKTGIIPTSSIEIEVKASFESGYNSALAYNTGLSASSIKGVYWQGSTGWGMNGRSVSYAVANGSIQTVIQNRNNVIVNGRQYNYNGEVGDFVGINELFIGGINSNKFSGNIYSFIVRFNGVMKRNFVPARRDSDGMLGMYDTVYMEFYTNQGSGSFTAGPDVIPQIKIATTRYNEEQFEPVETRLDAAVAAVDTVVTQTMSQAQAIDTIATTKQTRPDEGCTAKYCLLVEDEQGVPHWYPIAGANGVAHNLPAGYTELQYIESNGQAQIDTGIKITSNDIIETEFKNASSTVSGALYGVYDVSNGNNSSAFYANGTYYAYGAANVVVNTNVAIDTNWHNVIHNFVDGTLKLDNTTVEFAPFSFENNVNNHLFTRYYNGTYGYYFSGYVKKHKITRNGVVIINLIPSRRDSDGVVGMYDLADSNPETAFHTNAGTGEFIAGPDM